MIPEEKRSEARETDRQTYRQTNRGRPTEIERQREKAGRGEER